MSDKFIVAFDGSEASERALDFAVSEAKHLDATIIVVHVLEWLPYSFLTVQELQERHKRREEEMKRAKTQLLEPILESLKDCGAKVEINVQYGQVAETLVDLIKQKDAKQVLLGRTGRSDMSRLVFGSVVSNMAQVSPVPCTIVP